MSRGIVLAARNDGFGSRMVAFLNAMYVAEKFDLEFRFVWPSMKEPGDFHVVPPPSAVFSRAYRRAHQLPTTNMSTIHRVANVEFSREWVAETLGNEKLAGIQIDTCEATARLSGQAVAYGDFARLWSSIGWTEKIRRLMRHASSRVDPRAVAVHIRRGDIVEGESRHKLFNAKYAPLGWYRKIIGDLLEAGTPVLLFCDDGALASSLVGHFPDLKTIDRTSLARLSKFQRDIYELSALARCARVVAAHSGFSHLASLIAGHPLESAQSFIPGQDRRRLIETDLAGFAADYSPLSRAKELQWLAVELPEVLTPVERDGLLQEASILDPECVAYPRLRAVEMVERGDLDGAERVLSAAAKTFFVRSQRATSPLRHMADVLFGLSRLHRWPLPLPSRPVSHPFVASVSVMDANPWGSPERVALAATVSAARPDDDILLAFHADELRASGRARASLEFLEAALLAGRDAPLLRRLAMMASAVLRDNAKAVEHGRAALAAAPDDNVLALRVAWLLLKSGDKAGARDVMAKWVPADFRTAKDLHHLSRALEKVGRRGEAIVAARRAAELSPTNRHYQRRRESFEPLGSFTRRVRGGLGRARRLLGATWQIPAPR